MASSFEKSVKGATKVKLAAPKSKYVEHILIATHAGEAGIAEVFRALNNRLKDQTWTIVFKSLIIVHLMIREGEKDVTLKYLRKNPRLIAISNYTDGSSSNSLPHSQGDNPSKVKFRFRRAGADRDMRLLVQEQGRNIRHYSQYLLERARAFGEVKTDYVRNGEGRLRKLSVEKGLLREVECVQGQIRSLLRCSFLDSEVDNEITLTAFRLLVMDLLVFFHVVNEGVINVLEHYFEMSRFDAERALEIYKIFTKQTADVVEYLQTARRLETSTRLQIPNLKHAPTSLTQSLEEYLNDPDFDINRRQYLAAQEAKKNGSKPNAGETSTQESEDKKSDAKSVPSSDSKDSSAQPPTQQPKVAPDLIDFFDSIETEHTTIFTNDPQGQPSLALAQPQYAQPNFSQQLLVQPAQAGDYGTIPTYSTGNFQQAAAIPAPIQQTAIQPIRTDFTGHGFGGYTPQDQNSITVPAVPSIPQQYQTQGFSQAKIQQQFQHAMIQQPFQLQSHQTASPTLSVPSPQETNPFRQSMMMTGATSLASSPPAPKSTNPFARAAPVQHSTGNPGAGSISSYPTGVSPVGAPSSYATSPTAIQQPLRPTTTGTNPFARNIAASQPPPVPPIPSSTTGSASLLAVQATGVTNPFRASMMMQQQQQQKLNGQPTGTLPGWENIETIPVFPRAS
ncbi:ANTH domain-containing protein [Kalaharituber pfeilii]|nr:ANTH domain-containing protein [Kalaharituber pfeilii]